MRYVYSPTIIPGTLELMSALQAQRLVKFDGMNFLHRGKPVQFETDNPTIVCWGHKVPAISGLRMLNANAKCYTDIDLNRDMQHLAMNVGWLCIPFQKMDKEEYEAALPMVRSGKKLIRYPYKEFYGYGSSYVPFINELKVYVFKQHIVTIGLSDLNTGRYNYITSTDDAVNQLGTPVIEPALKLLKSLHLDFAVFTVARMKNNAVALRKINTTPRNFVPFINPITEWAKGE